MNGAYLFRIFIEQAVEADGTEFDTDAEPRDVASNEWRLAGAPARGEGGVKGHEDHNENEDTDAQPRAKQPRAQCVSGSAPSIADELEEFPERILDILSRNIIL